MGRAPTAKKSIGRASFSSNNIGRTTSTKKADLTTSEGLYSVAESKGGTIATKAKEIIDRSKESAKKGLIKTLDIISRPTYASASAVKNVMDDDPNTTFGGGLKSGITGKTKWTYTDVLEEGGWKPETKAGKIAKGISGFALDVLLDPTTYITLGAGAGVKVGVAGATKTLSKEGAKLLAKGVATKALTEAEEQIILKGVNKTSTFAEKKLYKNALDKVSMDATEMTKRAIGKMAEKSPELYKKFIDQGGIKFFGNTLISGGRIKGVADMIPGMTLLDETTQPIRNRLGALFNRDIDYKYGNLNKLGQISEKGATGREFVSFKNKINDLSKIKSADALNEIINIARANNLTASEAEIITDLIEKGLPSSDPRLENARKLFSNVMGRNLAEEQKVGIKIGELKNYVAHMLVDVKKPDFKFKPTKGRTIGKVVEDGVETIGKGKNAGRATISEINEAFGENYFDKNIINTAAIRSVASARMVAKQEFINGVKAFGADAATAPSGYLEVTTKGLDGIKFHPAVAEQIEKFSKSFFSDEATRGLMASFDKIQGLWKASVTSIFPAFHGRNAISNVFLNYLDIGKAALSPAKHVLSTNMIYTNNRANKLEKIIMKGGDAAANAKKDLKELMSKPYLTDDFGRKWTFGELRKEIKERRVAFNDEFTGALDVRETVKEKLRGKVSGVRSTVGQKLQKVNPLSQQNYLFEGGRATGNAIEQQARVLNFLTNLEKTGDVLTSADRTKQFLFDYTNLSDFEKNVMRRLIPFYTFMRKNLELQVTQSLKQPGKLATQAKIFTNISKVASGGSLTEEEIQNLPSYLQDGLGIVWSRDGDKVQIINTIGTPIESIFTSLKDNALLGSLSPVFAVPLQAAIGRHFFFEKNIEDVNDATAFKSAPQFIKDYIGFTVRKNQDGTDRYIALNPTRLFIIQNIPPSSRVIQTIGQLENENVSGTLKMLRLSTGLKPYGVDLSEAEARNEKIKMRELQDLLDKTGVAPVFKRSFIPKE